MTKKLNAPAANICRFWWNWKKKKTNPNIISKCRIPKVCTIAVQPLTVDEVEGRRGTSWWRGVCRLIAKIVLIRFDGDKKRCHKKVVYRIFVLWVCFEKFAVFIPSMGYIFHFDIYFGGCKLLKVYISVFQHFSGFEIK